MRARPFSNTLSLDGISCCPFLGFCFRREQKERGKQQKLEQEKEEKRHRQQEEERKRREEEEKKRKAEKEKADKEKAARKVSNLLHYT